MTNNPSRLETLFRIQCKNQYQLSIVSSSTMAKASGKNLLSPSYVDAISNLPLYLPYRKILSILITSLQCWKSSIDGPKDQNTLSNIAQLGTVASNVLQITLLPEFESVKTFNHFDNNWKDLPQSPNTLPIAFCFASYTLK